MSIFLSSCTQSCRFFYLSKGFIGVSLLLTLIACDNAPSTSNLPSEVQEGQKGAQTGETSVQKADEVSREVIRRCADGTSDIHRCTESAAGGSFETNSVTLQPSQSNGNAAQQDQALCADADKPELGLPSQERQQICGKER